MLYLEMYELVLRGIIFVILSFKGISFVVFPKPTRQRVLVFYANLILRVV